MLLRPSYSEKIGIKIKSLRLTCSALSKLATKLINSRDVWSGICKRTLSGVDQYSSFSPSLFPSLPSFIHWTAGSFILALPIRIQGWWWGKLSDLNKWLSLPVIFMHYCLTLFFCRAGMLLHGNGSGPWVTHCTSDRTRIEEVCCLFTGAICVYTACVH